MTFWDVKIISTWKNAVPIYRAPEHWWAFPSSVSLEHKQLDTNEMNTPPLQN